MSSSLRSRIDMRNEKSEKCFNIIIAVTGSVATIKLVELVNLLKEKLSKLPNDKLTGKTIKTDVKIRIVMTENSKHFMPKRKLINALADSKVDIYDDSDEWNTWKKMLDPVFHIELRKWADLCLIAPLDANTMAKIANGICDNLLTCLVRAWDTSKPLIYCPAMNVQMYNHPITREQLCRLQSFGYLRVDAIEKMLACGDFGVGAMASLDSIVNKVTENLLNPITRKPSLPKPILNQQPTYPIISLTEDKNPSNSINSNFKLNSNGLSLLNRLKTGNQISIHSVPNITIKNNATTESIEFDQSGSRRSKSSYNLKNNYKNNDSYGIYNPVVGKSRNGKSIGCTSLQNLNAATEADLNSLTVNNIPNSSEDDEEDYNDFDPSRLLEQSMVVDDDGLTANAQGSLNGELDNVECWNETEEPAQTRVVKDLRVTRILNTTKFLDLCYMEDRNCYTCSICHHDYQSRKSMARHFKEQHIQGNIYDCEPCGVSYKRKEQLLKHIKKHHRAN